MSAATQVKVNEDAELRTRLDGLISQLKAYESNAAALESPVGVAEIEWLSAAIPTEGPMLASLLEAGRSRARRAFEERMRQEAIARDKARRAALEAAEVERRELWAALPRIEKALWHVASNLGYEARARELLGALLRSMENPSLEASDPPPGFGKLDYVGTRRW